MSSSKNFEGYINVHNKELTIKTNSCLEKRLFPDELKIANVPPNLKKEVYLREENYKQVTS